MDVMVILITGGSGSGKSVLAERLADVLQQDGKKYYIATMHASGPEGLIRVERHRRQREGKGFMTLEQETDLGKLCPALEQDSLCLLECLSNLAANEMFAKGVRTAAEVVDKTGRELERLFAAAGHVIVVSCDVFEGGMGYDGCTPEYIEALGRIQEQVARRADLVVEVAAAQPIVWKWQKLWKQVTSCQS